VRGELGKYWRGPPSTLVPTKPLPERQSERTVLEMMQGFRMKT
jgi:hypothetical protein